MKINKLVTNKQWIKMSQIIRIQPQEFVHVLDLTSNVTGVRVGPQSLVLQSHEQLVAGPLPMVVVPPGHYCVIQNPCSFYEEGKACVLKHGHCDVRFHKEPFPLYPGEVLSGCSDSLRGLSKEAYQKAIKRLPIVPPNHAVRLEAIVDHQDGSVTRRAGDRWQVDGPLTYHPSPYAEILLIHKPHIIRQGEALKLVATQDFVDRNGRQRVTGEEWLVKETGAYLTGVHEEVIETITAIVLTLDSGLHLRTTRSMKDAHGKVRKAGEEWLITMQDTESFIPDIGVEVARRVKKTVLSKGQYCIILNPYDDKTGQNHLGKKILRVGNCSFFVHPGEKIDDGIKEAYILLANEAIYLQATEEFEDGSERREAGDKWMIRGPVEYIPPVHVNVLSIWQSIPLCKNEGIYVRNVQTGKVRAVMGPQSYMLTEYEELWKKELPDLVETLLKKGGGHGSEDIRKIAYFEQSIDAKILEGRRQDRLVTYRCPPNTACQVYNYIEKTARVVFGPDLVSLGPHENFNVLSLSVWNKDKNTFLDVLRTKTTFVKHSGGIKGFNSAGKPKREDALKSLCLLLGPDYTSDIIQVETSDHARLQIKLAFNNHFEYDKDDSVSTSKLFSIPDYIGFACRQIGSKIRVSVAQISFDEFHRFSSKIIQHAVFGVNKDGEMNRNLHFTANNLVVTSVDVQSIEPVDVKMRDSLAKSVQMAIEIATNSIEASASHEAERIEQAARGELERQKILNEKEAEKERTHMYELQAMTAAVESCGQAKAEAQAQAERSLIECHSEIEVAQLKAEAANIEHEAELDAHCKKQQASLSYERDVNQLKVDKTRQMADIETHKFSEMVKTIGASTIASIATTGPETQVKLLQSLGLQSTLITDGNNPINLFTTAKGLVNSS